MATMKEPAPQNYFDRDIVANARVSWRFAHVLGKLGLSPTDANTVWKAMLSLRHYP